MVLMKEDKLWLGPQYLELGRLRKLSLGIGGWGANDEDMS